jgi:hypothetical protein
VCVLVLLGANQIYSLRVVSHSLLVHRLLLLLVAVLDQLIQDLNEYIHLLFLFVLIS